MNDVIATRPIHPGEILADELEELDVTGAELARSLGVPPNRIYQLLAGKRAMTADTAMRLERWHGPSAQFWLRLQASYELDVARSVLSTTVLESIVPLRTESAA